MSTEEERNHWRTLASWLLFPLGVLFRGVVLCALWKWHVMTVVAVPAITVSQGVSLSVALMVIVARGSPKKDETLVQVILQGLLWNVAILGFAWLIHLVQTF